MLKKYDSFLLESCINDILLLEGYLKGSTDFIFKLKEISDKSDDANVANIAKSLLNAIENEHYISDDKLNQNYFDLADADDKLTFIQSNRLPDDFDDEDNPGLPYELPRNEIKIGRSIKYMCDLIGVKATDSSIEKFVNLFKASKSDTGLTFKLVKGDDIAKYYDDDMYYTSYGTLGGSCMGNMSKKTFKIYTENPKKVKMLVLLDSDDKVHGRALVWKLKKYPENGSQYFMDRVYTNRDSDDIKFRNFAKENNWMYKEKNNAYLEDNVCFMFNGKKVCGEVVVKLDGDFSKYPFVDTMCFLSKDKDSLSNLPDKKCYILHDTSGGKDRCDDCDGDIIDEDGDLCYDCASGHGILKDKGIETKWNKKA